mmetsp:Transcript_132878/g.234156  ORF Transcript_132878/g.234156 Transcript_132878/m.234156 type:complete len:122 (+) Transcript_132878:905-1270(+)
MGITKIITMRITKILTMGTIPMGTIPMGIIPMGITKMLTMGITPTGITKPRQRILRNRKPLWRSTRHSSPLWLRKTLQQTIPALQVTRVTSLAWLEVQAEIKMVFHFSGLVSLSGTRKTSC